MVLSEFMTLNEISDREESKGQLFVIVSTYRAKPGEEDAIIALHEDWQRKQGLKAKVYLSWELLRNTEAPREFIVIAHFASEELARAMADNLNQDAWYYRLVSLLEEEPKRTNCRREWQLT
jgi:antibiotic biosynthesis monooxygenase (ABM) superfamily enzyme